MYTSKTESNTSKKRNIKTNELSNQLKIFILSFDRFSSKQRKRKGQQRVKTAKLYMI